MSKSLKQKQKEKKKLLVSVCVCVCVAPPPPPICVAGKSIEKEVRPAVSVFVCECAYPCVCMLNSWIEKFYGASASPPHRDQPPPPVVERRRCRSSSSRPRPGFQWRSVLFIFITCSIKKKQKKNIGNIFFLFLSFFSVSRRRNNNPHDLCRVCVSPWVFLSSLLTLRWRSRVRSWVLYRERERAAVCVCVKTLSSSSSTRRSWRLVGGA